MARFVEESSSSAATAVQQEATAGSAPESAGMSEHSGARGDPPAAVALPVAAPAAAVPAPSPAKPPAAQFDLLSLDDSSNENVVAASAEHAAEATGTKAWDPFSHSAAAPAPAVFVPPAPAPAPAASRLDSWDAFAATASSQEQQQQQLEQAADPFDLMARYPSRSSSRASMGGTSDVPTVPLAVSVVQQQPPKDPFVDFGGDLFVPHAAPAPHSTVPVLHAAAPAPPATAPLSVPKQPQQPQQPQERPKLSTDHIMSLFDQARPGSSGMQPNHTKSASFSAYGSAGAAGLTGMQPQLQHQQYQPMSSLSSAPFTYTSVGGIAAAQPLPSPMQPGMQPPMTACILERHSASAAMGPAMRHSASAPQDVGAEARGSGLRHLSAAQMQVKHPATVVAMSGGPAREAQAAAKEVFSDFAVF